MGFIGKAMVYGSGIWLLSEGTGILLGWHWALCLGVAAFGALLWALDRALPGDEDGWL